MSIVFRTLIRCTTVLLLLSSASAQTNIEFFEDFSAPGVPGRLFIPPQAETEPQPLILFLHGAGESGTNNTAQINGNINNLLDNARERGAFIYAPQTDVGWAGVRHASRIIPRLDQIVADQNVDPDRIYVTGLSMGGGGTWNMASRFSDRFAAAVPIAGIGPASDFDATYVLDVPTWAFHARNDSVVANTTSREVVNRILTAVGEPTVVFPPNSDRVQVDYINNNIDLQYTEWASGGHGIWGRVYDTPEMYDWMFSQAVPEPLSGGLLILGLASLLLTNRRRNGRIAK